MNIKISDNYSVKNIIIFYTFITLIFSLYSHLIKNLNDEDCKYFVQVNESAIKLSNGIKDKYYNDIVIYYQNINLIYSII